MEKKTRIIKKMTAVTRNMSLLGYGLGREGAARDAVLWCGEGCLDHGEVEFFSGISPAMARKINEEGDYPSVWADLSLKGVQETL